MKLQVGLRKVSLNLSDISKFKINSEFYILIYPTLEYGQNYALKFNVQK